MEKLTAVQQKTLEFIVSHIDHYGFPPTFREIAAHFEWKSVSSAQDVVAALKRKGHLLPSSVGKSRQILTPHTEHRIPFLGSIAAGLPTETTEEPLQYVCFPSLPQNVRTKNSASFFALRVQGHSMILAGLLPGDLILVESQFSAKTGEIVAAQMEAAAVAVKRFVARGSAAYDRVALSQRERKEDLPPAYLVPENPDFSPLPFGTSEHHKILGVVRSLFRERL